MRTNKITGGEHTRNKVHFTDNGLIDAINPISVNLIGAGGTGSKVLTALMEMNHSLIALGHAGLSVRLWDDDIITEANLGRQRFAESETGLYKSVALINRANRFSGTNWKAETRKFEKDNFGRLPENAQATISISCVDSVKARFDIAEILKASGKDKYVHHKPKYWLDYGNSRHTGQVLLATIGSIPQPKSDRYDTVANLPFVTDEFADLLNESEQADDTPSCSLAEAHEEVEKHLQADIVILQTPVNWFGAPWIYKKYVDEVFNSGLASKKLLSGDGRTRTDTTKQYGSGGLMQGKKFMICATFNAPAEAFDNPSQALMQGKSTADLFLNVTSNYKFCGYDVLTGYNCFDIYKNGDIANDLENYTTHLATTFNL